MGIHHKHFSSSMMDDPVQNLKGKILQKPKEHMWRINKQASKEDWKYTVENTAEEWTPYNSNLQMQGIKVVVNSPNLEAHPKNGGAFEDTMLLLEIMKEKKQAEMKQMKEERIRQMALEQRRRKEQESSN